MAETMSAPSSGRRRRGTRRPPQQLRLVAEQADAEIEEEVPSLLLRDGHHPCRTSPAGYTGPP